VFKMVTKKYTLTIDTGKPYSEDYDTIDEVKKAIEVFESDHDHDDFPYCDIQLFDNHLNMILNVDEWIK
jgi:hypothetical protein